MWSQLRASRINGPWPVLTAAIITTILVAIAVSAQAPQPLFPNLLFRWPSVWIVVCVLAAGPLTAFVVLAASGFVRVRSGGFPRHRIPLTIGGALLATATLHAMMVTVSPHQSILNSVGLLVTGVAFSLAVLRYLSRGAGLLSYLRRILSAIYILLASGCVTVLARIRFFLDEQQLFKHEVGIDERIVHAWPLLGIAAIALGALVIHAALHAESHSARYRLAAHLFHAGSAVDGKPLVSTARAASLLLIQYCCLAPARQLKLSVELINCKH